MRTVTLEPEVLTPALNNIKSSSQSSKQNKINQTLIEQFNNFNFDQLELNIYSPSTLSSNTNNNEWKMVKSKSEPLSNSVNSLTSKTKCSNSNQTNCVVESQQTQIVTNECGQPLATDPNKRLRNLKKKLKEIETLKQKNPEHLEKEQLLKIQRYPEILEQIDQVTKLIEESINL